MKEIIDYHLLTMSTLNAVLTLKDYSNRYPSKTASELVELINAVGTYHSNYNYRNAQLLLNEINLSEVNTLRGLITLILKHTMPGWLFQVQFGREILASCLRDNEQVDVLQCLESAGLYSKEPDISTVEWWDDLAGLIRNIEDEKKMESGRKGERLTLEYEQKKLIHLKLKEKPEWISIENNYAGYDILSYEQDSAGLRHKMIEVKASQSRPIVFYLSKNEWNSAKKMESTYVFHIWYLPKERLFEFTVSDIERNIPINNGEGEWLNVLINIDKEYDM